MVRFLISEYAACVVAALLLGSVLLGICGIGYLLKLTGMMVARALRSYHMPSLKLVRERTGLGRRIVAWPQTFLLILLSASLVPANARGQQAAPSPPPDPAPYTLKVSVNEVLLHATVRNRKGTPVSGLGKDDFQVFEDRVLQPIRNFSSGDIPVTAGLVIDNSGSMGPKRAEVITAALAFASSSNPHDQLFLVNFNERVWFGLPRDTLFTDQPEQLRAAMRTVIADGKTALYDAVAIALEHLEKGNRDKKVLIVVSDGGDNASTHTRAQMLELATRSNAIIYTLGIYEPDDPENPDPKALKELAKASGGEAFFPQELRHVVPICERIAHDIRNQYSISYTPTNQALDGKYRAIQVRAASPGGRELLVTTRPGYIAPKPAAALKQESQD